MDRYPNATTYWVQEEPINNGAWTYVQPRLETAMRETGELHRSKGARSTSARGMSLTKIAHARRAPREPPRLLRWPWPDQLSRNRLKEAARARDPAVLRRRVRPRRAPRFRRPGRAQEGRLQLGGPDLGAVRVKSPLVPSTNPTCICFFSRTRIDSRAPAHLVSLPPAHYLQCSPSPDFGTSYSLF